MQGDYEQSKEQSQNLLFRRFHCIGIHFFIRALTRSQGRPYFFLFFAQPHQYYQKSFNESPQTYFNNGLQHFINNQHFQGLPKQQLMDFPTQKQHQKQKQQEGNQEYCQYPEQLPEIDPPSQQNHPSFFKVKTRINQEHLNVQIGVLVIKYDLFQEDFITYLANMLMCEVQILNIFTVDPSHLYITMNAATNQNGTDFDYIHLQTHIYALLKYSRELILKFIQGNISQNSIFHENGPNSEQIINRFQQEVIKPMNDRHQKLFSSKHGNKW